MINYVGDFETTVDPDITRVWASCIVSIYTLEVVHISTSIDDTVKFLESKNSTIYYHNLKFDGEFWVSWLLQNGYEYSDKPMEKAFTALITDTGLWYEITIYFKKKNKTWNKAMIRDSVKKLPFTVAKLAKDFRLPISKLEIDYKQERALDHKLTPEEIQYVSNDCIIVASALKIQFEQGLDNMTIGSDAMHNFKDMFTRKKFDSVFPSFPLDVDKFVRMSYRGGFTYLNPIYANKRISNGIVLDVNSLYPDVMYNCKLPYGYPVIFDGDPSKIDLPDHNLYIANIECQFDLKPGHIPTLQLKNSRFNPCEYLTSSNNDMVTMTLTNVDIKLMQDHYNVYNLSYKSGMLFHSAVGIFKDYIDQWMKVKSENTGAIRSIAKLMLNSLYGKFASNPLNITKVPAMDDETGIVEYEPLKLDDRSPVYTAMGSFITAYAREKTIRSAQTLYDRFIYADTDSLHLIGNDIPCNLNIHPTKLGAWKHEGTFIDSKYLRAKTYIETFVNDNGNPYNHVVCAGMPDNVKKHVTYDNFNYGAVYPGKLVPKRIKGGVILRDVNFTIMAVDID